MKKWLALTTKRLYAVFGALFCLYSLWAFSSLDYFPSGFGGACLSMLMNLLAVLAFQVYREDKELCLFHAIVNIGEKYYLIFLAVWGGYAMHVIKGGSLLPASLGPSQLTMLFLFLCYTVLAFLAGIVIFGVALITAFASGFGQPDFNPTDNEAIHRQRPKASVLILAMLYGAGCGLTFLFPSSVPDNAFSIVLMSILSLCAPTAFIIRQKANRLEFIDAFSSSLGFVSFMLLLGVAAIMFGNGSLAQAILGVPYVAFIFGSLLRIRREGKEFENSGSFRHQSY